ncbi:hypothetical protein H4219_005349 [Mycoemilia scoparia]|uniref:Acetoacetyl-CoA synthetase n=1 Tax=Mycoemilia scoparia TaxID=417184 RepID=A0A9W7ZND0_9FUNG|nr:hypothetical protein H4219_005349 [Mycoemilia scoparia]
MSPSNTGDTPLWVPKDVSSTQIDAFRQYVNNKLKKDFSNYDELYEWSCDDIESFWASVWDYVGIKASEPYTQVLEPSKPMSEIPKWFLGSKLNYAENILESPSSNSNVDKLAIISTGEKRPAIKVTFQELRQRVRSVASSLRQMGIKKGDRVVAYISNCVEAVVVMLASSSIGAIYASTSLDFGSTAVLERFSQIGPKVIFSVDATAYNGKIHSHMSKLEKVVDGLPTLEKVVIIPFDADAAAENATSGIGLGQGKEKWTTWSEFVAPSSDNPLPLTYEQLDFSHPLYVLFSSGTTGRPKCLVHSAGGMLIQHLKEHKIHQSLGKDDVLFYYTTTGWMMWNWLVSGLAVGATIVLYEGSPLYPDASVLWKLVDEFGITAFGTSARYIQTLEDKQYHPNENSKLDTLHSIYSTASPLKPSSYAFVYKHIKSDLCLGSITGGTDICSLFCGANTGLSVYSGHIQCRNLGMAIQAYGHDGKSVYGDRGDMVCDKPFPCMPIGLWNDANNERYLKTYFNHYPDIWYHGDFIVIDPAHHGVMMLGRSDGTLNPHGVRFGSAELYDIVDQCEGIEDSLVVGQRQPDHNDDERVLMFLKMAPGCTLGEDQIKQLRAAIRSQLSPRHVPDLILSINDIPYTINGKKVEIAVKKLVSELYRVAHEPGNTPDVAKSIVKLDPKDVSTLANPESLEQFYNYPAIFA